ncbi:MAG: gliding motility-associated C-terminal domain-containing protein [Bacteroidota bacterium]
MKNLFLLLSILLLSTKAFAQPSNNECSTATNMGSLPAPGACASGLQNGAVVSFTGTNVGATPSLQGNGNSYQSILDCEGILLNDQGGPALDVWYSFVATGTKVNINIGGYANANFGIWTGACSNLQPVGCSTDGAIVLEQMNIGQSYYIQVSGDSPTSTDASFTVNIDNDIDCNDCFRDGTLSVNPLPVNGQYDPGQSVTFCFHVDKFQQTATNWLHGVQFAFGGGWDLTTLTAASVTANAPTTGSWAYYPGGCTSTATGLTFGAGFYFNRSIRDIAAGEGVVNANPGNNFGDGLTGGTSSVLTVNSGVWNFCITLKTSAVCNPGASLGLTINTSGDGESGGWDDPGCSGDPATTFVAYSACCPPTMSSTSVSCNGGATGSATATPIGATGPYTYNWSGPSSYSNNQTSVAGASTISGLVAGTYTLITTDASSCAKTTTVIVTQPTSITATPTFTNATCVALGTASVASSGGTPGYTYSWSPSGGTGSSATGLSAGAYTVVIRDSKLCAITKTVNINSTGTVTSTFNGAGTQCLNGNTFTFNNTGSSGTGITHAYSFSPITGAPAASSTSTVGTYGPVSFTAPGTFTVTHTVVNGVCVNTTTATVIINPNPLATLTSTNPTCGLNNGQVFIYDGSLGVQTVTLFTSSLGTTGGSQTVTALGAGTPIITLTNNFGCTFTVSATLTMTPGPTGITITPTNATCGNTNGSFTFGTPVGGTSTYSYAINGGAFSATSPTTGLAPATYSVTIKDANGCVFTKTTSIIDILGPTAIAGASSPASCAGPTGSYTVTGVTGGTSTYSYSIDGGAFAATSVISNLASGTHSIIVKDANGCTFPTTFSVGVIAGITSATVNASTASCGISNGSSTVTGVTGGVAAYSYSFDGGGFTASASTTSLAAGNHTVIVKDVNTCTLSVPYTVLSLGSPTTSITSFSNVTCFGLSNGSATVAIPTGGAGAPFSYSISTSPLASNGTGQFSGLPAGSYNITVRDVGGCIATTTVTISQPTTVSVTPSSLPAKCFGTPTGTINVVGSGGTPTYSYNLNGGSYQASTVFVNQTAGTYLMGIRDANGCNATQTVTITQPTALAISVSSQNANCTAANGIGSSTVTGGTGTITYSWTPTGGAAATSNSVVAGNYSVTAIDANGCVVSSPVVVGLTPGGVASITGSTNITCNGLCNGNLTAGMTGGTAPFTYSWTSVPTQTTAAANNLCPGTYSCTITDFYGCKSTTSGSLTQPPVLTSIMNSNNVKCFNTPTGTVAAAGTGGTGPYTYSWPTLASTLSTVPNVAVGNYTCIITDFNGCSISSSITVTQPTSITLTSSVTPANCGQANGSATINISGGTSAYTQTWSPGSTSTVQSGVAAGTYTIQVKDANNCLQTLAVTIPNTSGPAISVISQTNVSCFGACNGIATTSVSGGITPYSYSWSNGQVTTSGTNLCAGIYTVSATDFAGCVTSTSVNITQPTALTVTISPTNPKCFGATNGFGTAAALGGTPSYTYSWGVNGSGPTSNQIGAGSYGLTVTDGNGCVVTSSMALSNPPAMVASLTSSNVTCFNACNGLAIATVTNNIGAVSYVWTGGASPVSSQTLTGACAGNYTVLATDQNSCTANVAVIISQPTQVTANISATGSVTCFGGNNGFAVVTPGGGTGSFTYSWSPNGGNAATAGSLTAGPYVVTVADANGCIATATATINQPAAFTTTLTTTNVKCFGACDGTGNIAFTGGIGIPSILWQPGLQNGNSVNNLCVGNNTVTITSNGSCISVITFTLTEPAALTAVAGATNSNCGQANGKTCVVVGGGTAPYSNLWSNGPTSLCNNGIVAGAYSFTVTDLYGCKAVASGLVNDIAGPVVAITSQTNISCFGGSNGGADINVTGGVTPYSYLWSGTSYTTANVSTFNFGIKNITVTDAAGCVGTAFVDITQPTQLTSAIGSFTNVSCFGQTNGGATMLVNGGTPNYSYVWTPSAQTSSILVNVGANSYTCNVTDGNGCVTSKSVTISQPQALTITASSFTDVSCFGGNNGQISITIQNGTPAYGYTWTPAQPGSNGFLTGLTAGGYTLALTDANNCPIGANFTISQPSALTSTYTSLPATCGNPNGSATVTITGGTPTYSVSWNTSPVQSGTVAINMSPGSNWSAVITDAKGCSISQSVAIANPLPPSITGFSVTQPACTGMSNGAITVNYTSGTAPYNVIWSNPISQTITTSALTQSVSGVAAGQYNATVVDNYGCSVTQPVYVAPPNILVLIPSLNTAICYGQSTQISADASGGAQGVYTYSWTPNLFNGGGPHTVSPTTTTSYIVSVTDINGCQRGPSVITVAVTPSLAISGFSVTKCAGDFVTLSPTISSPGNGGPYNFAWSTGQTFSATPTSSISIVTNSTMASPSQYTVTIDDKCTIPTGTAVFTVNINQLPVIDFTAPSIGCAPLSVTLTGTSNGGANDVFTWNSNKNVVLGPGNPMYSTISDSGIYAISLNVLNTLTGCSKTITKPNYIEVYPQPTASFYADPLKVSILDPNFNFINTSQGATTYYWDFGDPAALNGSNTSTVMNPSHGYSYVGEYKVNLIAISPRGCRDIASQIVEVIPDFSVYIPNSFTPDENGLNDIFQPLGVGIDEENYRLDIFDRWGENIFTSNNFRKGWDGSVKGGSKPAPQGVYIYKLMVHDILGNKHPYVGHVTVIRRNTN